MDYGRGTFFQIHIG